MNFAKALLPALVPQSHVLPTWLALLLFATNENATFIWNYIDIFIMIMGIGLSTHFKLLNIELEQASIEVRNLFAAYKAHILYRYQPMFGHCFRFSTYIGIGWA